MTDFAEWDKASLIAFAKAAQDELQAQESLNRQLREDLRVVLDSYRALVRQSAVPSPAK